MFDVAKVTKVYSGNKGCMCGCKGKYTYACRAARPSYYDPNDDEMVSHKGVKMMVAKIERFLRDPNSNVARVLVDSEGMWVSVDMHNDRTYAVYFD